MALPKVVKNIGIAKAAGGTFAAGAIKVGKAVGKRVASSQRAKTAARVAGSTSVGAAARFAAGFMGRR